MSTLRGPLLMVAAMAGFAMQDAIMKDLVTRIPPGMVALWLGIGGALAFSVALWRKGEPLFDRRALKGAALLRNACETGAVITILLSVALVPLSVMSSILQAMPLAVTLGAALFLGEKAGWRRWTAILVGFFGVMLILRPGTTGFDAAALVPLAAVFFLSTRDLATKRLDSGISSLQVSAWGFAAVIPGGLLLLAMRGESLVVPSAGDAALLTLNVVVGMTAYVMLVLSTRTGNIATTTPFRYARLVFSMGLGVVLFGERPDIWTLTGSVVIVVAGLYTLVREIQLGRRPVPTAETPTLP